MYFDHIDESASVFKVLMGCFIATSTTYIFGTLLTANGNLKYLNLVAAGGLLLNIVLNIFLIPAYGSLGSAWASLITQSIMAVIQLLLAVYLFKFRLNILFVIKIIVFFAGIILINKYIPLLGLSWIKSMAVALLASVLLALFLQLFNLRSFIKLFLSETHPSVTKK
jgi:O-antigen/teichoic acid export membrane protein